MKSIGYTVIFCLSFLISLSLHAQKNTPVGLIQDMLRQSPLNKEGQTIPTDQIAITDQYQTAHNQVLHIYFQQQFQKYPIFGTVSALHLNQELDIQYQSNRFVYDVENKVTPNQNLISAEKALLQVLQELRLPYQQIEVKQKPYLGTYEISAPEVSKHPILMKRLWYHLSTPQIIIPAWEVNLSPNHSSNYWHYYIDGRNGQILHKWNETLYCAAPHHSAPSANVPLSEASWLTLSTPTNTSANSSYRVFPFPVESPIHGEQALISNPSDAIASPFGWHDSGGPSPIIYTITRGNNAHAYLDLDDRDFSQNDEPNGGEQLVFDYPYDPSSSTQDNQDAAVTQAFFATNYFHDLLYHYGFDEGAGNFQENNLTGAGQGNDPVRAHVQDGSNTNNATFRTPADGSAGVMQLHIFENRPNQLLEITAPTIIQGRYTAGVADFGPEVSDIAMEGLIVEAFDQSANADKGCENIINGDGIAGNIAMVNRGLCFFEQKTIEVEKAGAIALIICNFEEETISMSGVAELSNPSIPTISLTNRDCQKIRMHLSDGVEAKLQRPSQIGNPFFDVAFDNGVIAHELAHGLSNRLTGGPSQNGCLTNDEQMGEGWSDFFTLITTIQQGDRGEKPRFIGEYVANNGQLGNGFRRLPYSTDFNLNNQTYEDIVSTTAPHDVGEVWTGVLWDLFWRMVDVYGWDNDLKFGNGGNNLAIQLVVDGLKLQACNPGFLDGRDAILAADRINNGGANECLIWEVFARRGLGWNAQQNHINNRNDGVASFHTRPSCIKELKIEKEMTPVVQAGDTIQVTLKITNHLDEPATQVVVTDVIPDHTSILDIGAGDFTAQITESELIVNIDQIEPGQIQLINYFLVTNPDRFSTRLFFDDFETGDNPWLFDAFEGVKIWTRIEDERFRNGSGWFVPATNDEHDQILVLWQPLAISSPNTAVRFVQRYQTQPAWDGGILELSTDNGQSWSYIPENLIVRNTYRGRIAYRTFSIPSLRGFWGDQAEFVDTYVDLGAYQGEEILFRFRFGTDQEADNTAIIEDQGWWIDEFEIIELFNYNSQACIRSEQSTTNCTIAEEKGTIVSSQASGPTSITLNDQTTIQWEVFPNPSNVNLNLVFNQKNERSAPTEIRIYNTNGKLYWREKLAYLNNQTIFTSDWPSGMYTIQVNTRHQSLVKKWIKQD